MAKTTRGDPFRELAELSARDPAVARLLKSVCEIEEGHGSEGVESFIDMLEKMLGIQSEQRAPFRVIEGGK